MVGGVAINLNGYQRTTDAIDVWIEDTQVSRENYRKAYKEYLGIDITMMSSLQIIPGWTNFTLNNGFKLDLQVNMKGLEEYSFDDCLKQAKFAEVNGITIPFLHINHLLANKKAVNRPRDQADVIYLERIIELQKKAD